MSLTPLKDANGNVLHDANGNVLRVERVAETEDPPVAGEGSTTDPTASVDPPAKKPTKKAK